MQGVSTLRVDRSVRILCSREQCPLRLTVSSYWGSDWEEGLFSSSSPDLYRFPFAICLLKTQVYHPTATPLQSHIQHFLWLFHSSPPPSFLWFHPQIRRHVAVPTESSHHDRFPSTAVFHQTAGPEGQTLITIQNRFLMSAAKTMTLWRVTNQHSISLLHNLTVIGCTLGISSC